MAKNYVQGIYEPLNKNKYKGSTPIIYRSSLEKRIFYLLDSNKNGYVFKVITEKDMNIK